MAGPPWNPRDWDAPRVLLAVLVVALATTATFGATTSQADYGVYNTGWDGVSGVRSAADGQSTESTVVLGVDGYGDPDDTAAFVLAPDRPYDDRAGGRVAEFVRSGGTLVVADDFGSGGNSVLRAIGADARFDGRPLRDERRFYRAPELPVAGNVTDAPATAGVDAVTLNHGTAVSADGSAADTTVLVRSSRFSYLDTDRDGELDGTERLGGRPVVVRERVGEGTVYAVSDPSVFINAMLERDGNRRLLTNVVGAHGRVLVDVSHRSSQPPLSSALVVVRGSPWLQGGLGVVAVLAVAVGGSVSGRRRRLWRQDRAASSTVESEREAVDREALAAYLRRRNPDWDPRRVRRVIGGVLSRDPESGDDE